jgi:hypothetical protein
MQTILIKQLTPKTQEICAIRLVGGFDSEKKHYPALDLLRFDNKHRLAGIGIHAETGCHVSLRVIESFVIGELVRADDVVFDGVRYRFDIKSFSEPSSLEYLIWEVLAQIVEEQQQKGNDDE